MYEGPGIYRHYKGGEYEVIGLAIREATKGTDHEIMDVIYKPLTPGSILENRPDVEHWSRPLDEPDEDSFNDKVPKVAENGQVFAGFSVPRFEKIPTCDHVADLGSTGVAVCTDLEGHDGPHRCKVTAHV